MNLIINWTSPIPYPSNDFQIDYRRNYDPAYTGINTSGTTSGSTYLINVSAPANYEGFIESHCDNAENYSDPIPFGVNAYQPFHFSSSVTGTVLTIIGTIPYPNTYSLFGSITIYGHTTSGSSSVILTGTYPAGNTTYNGIQMVPLGTIIDNIVVNSLLPIFDNGGELQQYDSVNTPPYIKVYWDGNTSGTTWFGSPLTLPSFILQVFNVTAVDVDNNPLAGNLIVTWIADSIYNNAVSPYNQVTFTVYDPDTSVMGSTNAYPATLGLQTAVIPITMTSAPLSTSTEFTMTTQWGDNTVSATVLFYLPNF